VSVADLDGYVDKALKAGGGNAHPKMAIKGVGWLAFYGIFVGI